MNPLLSLRPPRGSKEAVADLHRKLAGLGVQPDNTRTAFPVPPRDEATIGPPTLGVGGLPVAPLRAPEGIPIDLGPGGRGVVPLEMLENVAALSSAPSRAAGKATKALADLALPRLSALHNTTEEKLAKSLDLGGFPVPSVAVVPEHVPFTDFGPITLIGKQSLGDPATSRVWSADAYTTRVPERVFPKLSKKQVQETWKNITGGYGNRFDDDAFRSFEDGSLDGILNRAHFSPGLRRAVGLNSNLWDAEPLSSDDYKKLEAFVADKFGPLLEQGQVNVGRERRPWTLDNVAEAMSKKGRLTEDNGDFTPGKVRAANATLFKSLEPMRRAAAQNVRLDNDAYQAAEDELRIAANEIASLVGAKRQSASAFDEMFDAALRAASGRGDIATKLRNSYPMSLGENPDAEDAIAALARAAERFKQAPVKYFESKPQRGVRFDEFAGAAVPEGTSEALVERLRNAGLQVSPYKVYGDSPLPDMREPAVEKFRRLLNEQGGNTLFSLGALGAGLGAASAGRRDR